MKNITLIFIILFLWSCKHQNSKESVNKTIDNKASFIKTSSLNNIIKDDSECEPSPGGDYYILTSHRSMIDYGEDFLIFMPKTELRFIRNSIFATKGYKFKQKDLTQYFSEMSWYCPKYDHVDSLITVTEKENISFIKKFETTNNKDTLNKSAYFLKLFEKKYTNIPMFFQKYYFGYTKFDNCCFTDKLVKQNKDFATIIYFTYPCPPPGHVEAEVFISTVDNNGNIVDHKSIGESYEILENYKIKYTEIESQEAADESFRIDTVGVYYYEINERGMIIETAK